MKNSWCKIALIFIFFFAIQASYAENAKTKELLLTKDKVYLLIFNSKVQKYSAGKENAFSIEIPESIYNDKWEILIRPKENISTNLIVWTDKGLFNFDISVADKNNQYNKIINNNEEKAMPDAIKAQLGGLELDLPPMTLNEVEVSDFILDKPPFLPFEKREIQ